MKGVPFFALVKSNTFGVAMSSSMKVLILLEVISMHLSVMNFPAWFLRVLTSLASKTGAGNGG